MKWRPTGSLLGLALGCAALYACGDDSGATCGDGTELIGGSCVPTDAGTSAPPAADSGMSESVVCGDHSFMLNGKCQGLLPIGAACERGAQCESETCIGAVQGFLGGYCTVPSCNDQRTCPSGSHCFFSSAQDRTICLAFCDPGDKVRDDNPYVCQPIPGSDLSLLAPSCNTTDSCPDQTVCDKSSGKCVLRECDVAASDPCDTQSSHRICYPDRRHLTTLGGLCLSQCDPKDSQCKAGDHCQPLPEDPANQGICVPPVCTATSECPVGSMCKNDICQPPARCDSNAACSDDGTVCVGGAGGQCMPKCPSQGTCSDIHSGLICAQSVAAAPVCLPQGSFPGSACRADKNNACDSVRVGTGNAKMVCENDTCLVQCATGGDALCAGLKDGLSCATGIYDEPVCLPNGAYPGGPCGAANSCQDVNLSAGVSAKMQCKGNLCVFDCASSAIGSSDATAYCAGIDASLTCSAIAYPGSSVCLPTGSVPGGPCTHGTCGKLGNTQMVCENNLCLLTCNPAQDTCASVESSLLCAHGIFDQDVCLPKGSFPGSACGGTNHDQCDQDLNGVEDIDMQCKQGTCVVGCNESGKWAGYGEAICHFTDPSLTCAQAAGSICVQACDAAYGATKCPGGYSCLASENACLPNGSFPGAACATGNACGAGPNSSTMSCQSGACVVDCAGSAGDTLCNAISDTLTCSDAAGGHCLLECSTSRYGSTRCPSGYSCLGTENACLPNGSFPGAACATGNSCGAGPAGSTMSCQSGACVVDCAGSAGDTLCNSFSGGALTCSDAAGGHCIYACNAAFGPSKCPSNYSCFASENACLPNGSFPGAACAQGNTCGAGPANSTMSCLSGTCVVNCTGSAGDALCSGISSGVLTCSDASGGHCVRACNAGACSSGFSCLGVENSCLPNGTFLGSSCAANDTCSGSPMLVCVDSNKKCAAGCSLDNGQGPADGYCSVVGTNLGTGYNTCTDLGGGLEICTKQ